MYAVIYKKEGLKVVTDRARPLPLARDKKKLLVKVHAAAICPLDYKVNYGLHLNRVVGRDFSGEVIFAPFGSKYEVGDCVFGNAEGTLAEYIYANVDHIAKKPTVVSHVDAASIPTAGLAVLQAFENNGLDRGARLLVIGASGGCGSFAVEIGKAMGAYVTAICGPKHKDFVKSLGADEVLNYADSLAMNMVGSQEATKYDLIFDTVSGRHEWDYQKKFRGALKKKGVYMATNVQHRTDEVRRKMDLQRKHFDLVKVHKSSSDLTKLIGWLEIGRITAHTHVYFLKGKDDVRDAFDMLMGHHATGKLVFDCIHDAPANLPTTVDAVTETAIATEPAAITTAEQVPEPATIFSTPVESEDEEYLEEEDTEEIAETMAPLTMTTMTNPNGLLLTFVGVTFEDPQPSSIQVEDEDTYPHEIPAEIPPLHLRSVEFAY